jgi:outer membrane protein assembly factor BamB
MHPTPVRAFRFGALLLLFAGLGYAGNWDRFRGPNGDGDGGNAALPTAFTKDNVLWKVEVPGVGHSSPVVWGDKLFVQTAAKDGSTRSLVCFNALTGDKLWSQGIKAQKAHSHKDGSLASSTPTIDAERVYTIFWDGERLHACAYTHDGKEVWKKDLGAYVNEHSFGGSPVVVDGRLFFNNDQGNQDSLKNGTSPAMAMALDAKTGETLWTAKRKGFRCCMSPPIFHDRTDGKKEVIFASTASVTGYDPATGTVIWNHPWEFPPKKEMRTIGTPVIGGNLLFAYSGDGSGARNCLAIKLNATGELNNSKLAWELHKGTPYVSSILVKGDHFFVLDDKIGTARCFEAATGKEVWSNRLSDTEFYASPVLVSDRIYAINRAGEMTVLKADTTYNRISTFDLGEPVAATPAVANDRLYIRGQQHLFCLGKR